MQRQEETQNLCPEFALDRLSFPHWRDDLRPLPAFGAEPACEQALDQVLCHRHAPAALAFLPQWPDRHRLALLTLAHLILERPDQLDGGD